MGSINVLVLDVGTSSMRGILFDEAGRILLQAQKKYRPEYKSPAWIEQPASDFKDALLEISTSVAEGARNLRKNIEVISITAQRSAVIPLGGDGDAPDAGGYVAGYQERRALPGIGKME